MKKFSTEEWARVMEAFEHVLSLDASGQHEYLQTLQDENKELAEEIKRLLVEDRNLHPILNRSAAGIWQHLTNDELLIGTIIGSYKLTGLLGTGAMGSVFSAERADDQFIQSVALKLIRQGLYSEKFASDFKKERQILANLQHPNIASLFDGGLTDDARPWFSMEYVNGEKINEYCREHTLSVKQKVLLFKQVCQAVQYAHANLVVHLDLKPGNILVNKEGLVKVLDFGVAHSFSAHPAGVSVDAASSTEVISYQFTLGYAAPEQLKGLPVSTACDIYSAGTILYELLAGAHPFEKYITDSAALSKAILTETPKLLDEDEAGNSGQHMHIGGSLGDKDLEAICRKALAKQPSARYAGMEALLLDIENWLNEYPVMARNGGRLYRAKKYYLRHKLPVSIILISVLSLIATIGIYTQQLRKQRDLALKEAKKSNEVMKLMLNIFSMADPNIGTGEDITAVALLKSGAGRMEEDLQEQPEELCVLLRQMASAFNALSVYTHADTISEKALNVSLKTFPKLHEEVAAAYSLRGAVLNSLGYYDSSIAMLYRAYEIYKALGEEKSEDGLLNLYEISTIHYNRGEYRKADSVQIIVYEINRKRLKPPHTELANDLMAVGINKRKLAAYNIADSFLQASLQMKQQLYKPPHPELAYSYNFLSSSKQDIGDYEAALPLAKEAYNQYMNVLDSTHPETLASLANLARIYSHLGYLDSAAALYDKGIHLLIGKYNGRHHYIGAMMQSLGKVRMRQKRYKEAEELLISGNNIIQKHLSPGDVKTADGYSGLGNLYLVQQQYEKAYSPLKKAYEILAAGLPEGHNQTGASQFLLAKCLIGLQRNKEALPLLEAALASLQKVPGKYGESISEIQSLIDQETRR